MEFCETKNLIRPEGRVAEEKEGSRDEWPHVLTRISRSHYFDPHPPHKMADFGVQLAPSGGGHISGPKWGISKVFQAYFEPPPNFIMLTEMFKRQPHALTRIIRGRYFDPHSPHKMASWSGHGVVFSKFLLTLWSWGWLKIGLKHLGNGPFGATKCDPSKKVPIASQNRPFFVVNGGRNSGPE